MPRADTLQPLARALRWQSDWWDSIVAGQQPNPWDDGHVDDSLGERVAEALRSSVIDVLIRMRFDQLAKMAGCAAWFSAGAQHEPAKDLQSAAPGVRWADYAPSLDLFLDSHPALDELNRAANQLWSAARRQWDAATESTKSHRGTPSLQLAAQGSSDPRSIDPSTDENAPGKRPSPPSEDSDERR